MKLTVVTYGTEGDARPPAAFKPRPDAYIKFICD